jgi:hypothetical protein
MAASHKITYRVYFKAIGEVLRDTWDMLLQALVENGAQPETHIDEVQLIVEKHGSDYHPARIRVLTPSRAFSFVINVAVTERGKGRLFREFDCLRYLRAHFPRPFVPRVYFATDGTRGVETKKTSGLAMFLAEWFEGYHEFHLSVDRSNGSVSTILWDMNRGYRYLTSEEAGDLYRQVAYILTYYHDTAASKEIFPWHHASGDFVARVDGGKIDVKLISVRQYDARVVMAHDSLEHQLEVLLLFFANLTLRMRLDRLDGVGDIAWAGEHCVEATIRGFSDAMASKVVEGRCAPALFQEFREMVQRMSPGQLAAVFRRVVESYDESAPDLPVIRENLVNHILKVFSGLQNLPCSIPQIRCP